MTVIKQSLLSSIFQLQSLSANNKYEVMKEEMRKVLINMDLALP